MKRKTEAQEIAAWLTSAQAGLRGDERVQRAAVLLVQLERRCEQEQRFKYRANRRVEKAEDRLRRVHLLSKPKAWEGE